MMELFAARPALAWTICILAAVIMPFVYGVLVEFQRTASVYYLLTYLEVRWYKILISVPLFSFAFIAFSVMTRRPWVGALTTGIVLFAFGTANRYKLQYRNEPLIPRDFYQAKEGLLIAQELGIGITREIIVFVCIIVLFCVVLSPLRLPKFRVKKQWLLRIVAGVGCFLLAIGYEFCVIGTDFMQETFGLSVGATGYAEASYRNTAVTNFCYLIARDSVEAPEDYSEETMLALLEEIQQYEAPEGSESDVIFILLESYYHFDESLPITFSESLTTNYDLLAQEGITGKMLSDCYGGGTAIIEYSGITGFVQAFYPESMVPYIETVQDGDAAYTQYLNQNGYTTFSLHGYNDALYNRVNAYPMLGIQESYWDYDYVSQVYDNSFLTDMCTMEQLVYLYEDAAQSDAPIYAHVVTMQNHVDVAEVGTVGDNTITIVDSSIELTDQDIIELEAMATSLYEIDEAIAWICDYFAQVDRNVTLVFFGDHQTDAENGVVREKLYASLDGETSSILQYTTEYLIWSNFETVGEEIEGYTSVWNLFPLATSTYGITSPLYFDYLAANFDLVQAYSAGYVSDGETTSTELTAEQEEYLHKLDLIQYDATYGKQYITAALFELEEE